MFRNIKPVNGRTGRSSWWTRQTRVKKEKKRRRCRKNWTRGRGGPFGVISDPGKEEGEEDKEEEE